MNKSKSLTNDDMVTFYRDFISMTLSPPPEGMPEKLHQLWHIGHCALGLVGEWLELEEAEDDDNELEEFGDIFWYAFQLGNLLSIIYPSPIDPVYIDNHVGVQNLRYTTLMNIENLSNSAKRVVYYGDGTYVGRLTACVGRLTHDYLRCPDWRTIMTANIEKLSKRYPALEFHLIYAQKRLDKQ